MLPLDQEHPLFSGVLALLAVSGIFYQCPHCDEIMISFLVGLEMLAVPSQQEY